jgi:hypothetical protein
MLNLNDRDLMLFIQLDALYVVWVLVPLVPAVIIYLLFPTSDTKTEWKILGIALRAGGASGFYFAILGLAYFKFLEPTSEYIKSSQQPYWIVDAPIMFLDADKNVINSKSSLEHLIVEPFAYHFKKTGEMRYLVTLKFAELKGEVPDNIRLIFPEGEGFIDLKKLKSKDNTNFNQKKIDLTKEKPIEIHPPLSGGQNRPAVAGLPNQLERGLETQ